MFRNLRRNKFRKKNRSIGGLVTKETMWNVENDELTYQ